MTIYETLKKDMVDAMKAKEKERLTVIRMVKSAMDLEHIDKKRALDDELAIDVLTREVKTRNESLETFEGRTDLAEGIKRELEILKKYMPKALTEEEVRKIIDDACAEVKPESMKDMGRVMGIVTPKVKGRFDLKQVSTMVRENIQN